MGGVDQSFNCILNLVEHPCLLCSKLYYQDRVDTYIISGMFPKYVLKPPPMYNIVSKENVMKEHWHCYKGTPSEFPTTHKQSSYMCSILQYLDMHASYIIFNQTDNSQTE